jgi:hypothetical protein
MEKGVIDLDERLAIDDNTTMQTLSRGLTNAVLSFD